jgi:hypothetical protein
MKITTIKRRFALITAMIMALTLWMALPLTTAAAEAGAFTIALTNGGELTASDYAYTDNVLTIKSARPMTIGMANMETTTADRIEVAENVDAVLTLNGVNIDVGSTNNLIAALDVLQDASLDLTLEGDNTLKSGYFCAGLQLKTNANLRIDGEGSLTAETRAWGAGIGAGVSTGVAGDIIITGGNIEAIALAGGAGIGAGWAIGNNIESGNGSCGNITITGGTIMAKTNYGAGIGAGLATVIEDEEDEDEDEIIYSRATCGDITITGGLIMAINDGYTNASIGVGTATIPGYGTGIGAGFSTPFNSASCGNISIEGGLVVAVGGTKVEDVEGVSSGFDIGTGIVYNNADNSCGPVTIDGGSVWTRVEDEFLPPTVFPAPKNSADAFLYANTLTVSSFNEEWMSIPITGGAIDGVLCADTPDAEAGVYGIEGIQIIPISDDDGKVCFWLPENDSEDTASVALVADNVSYGRFYAREATANTETLPESWSMTGTPSSADAPLTGSVVLTFSQTMDTTPGTVTLKRSGTSALLSGGNWSDDDKVYTLPYENLTPETAYAVEISGFKSSLSIAAMPYDYSFTTTAGPAVPPVTPSTYALNVTNGTGSGSFAGGAVVNIIANSAPDGEVFDKWTGGNGGTFGDEGSAATSFTMPANDATVTATYKNDLTDTDGDGVPDYVEEQQGTDPTDKNDFKDTNGDGIPDYVEDHTNPPDDPPKAKNGWVYGDGVWKYFIDSVAKTGWVYDQSKWYYLNASGIMQTGWVYDTHYKTWYYLAGNGTMKTGWVKDNGTWYYLLGNGAMVAAKWLHDTDGSWYYLSGNGKMLTGKQSIGAKTYTFKGNGVWVS